MSDQPSLPGAEDAKNTRIHNAALRYRKEMLARKMAGEKEKDAHTNLVRIMHEEGMDTYRNGNIAVYLDKTEKAKVTETTKGGGDEEE